MKSLLILILGVCCVVNSCKSIDKSASIIEGSGFDKNIKKFYLTSALKWEVFLDSVECVDGKFKFNYRPPTGFEPFLAGLYYLDSNNIKKIVYVRNKILMKKNNQQHASNGFMFDYGITKVKFYGLSEHGSYVDMEGGPEQDLLQEHDAGNIGFITKVRTEEREAKYKRIKKLIRDNSFSFYLLRQMFSNRGQYSKDELKEIFQCFDKAVQNSRSAERLKEYLLNSLEEGEHTRSLSLTSDKNIIKKDINKTAKLNMLIFWASWCGPCRLEIPQLKKINQMVRNEDFYMASISIDENKKDWDVALSQEKLTWDQFRVEKSEKDKIKAQYGFIAIPLIIFTNRDGKELARYIGYSEDHVSSYKKLIADNLNIKLD